MINISSMIILYDFCFKESLDSPDNLFSTTAIYYVIEGFFAVFIILQFFQTYQDPATLLVITDFKKIALKYIKSWFIIDFLSIIPYEIFFSKNDANIKYFKMIRLLRLPKFIQTMDIKRLDNLASSFLLTDRALLTFAYLLFLWSVGKTALLYNRLYTSFISNLTFGKTVIFGS